MLRVGRSGREGYTVGAAVKKSKVNYEEAIMLCRNQATRLGCRPLLKRNSKQWTKAEMQLFTATLIHFLAARRYVLTVDHGRVKMGLQNNRHELKVSLVVRENPGARLKHITLIILRQPIKPKVKLPRYVALVEKTAKELLPILDQNYSCVNDYGTRFFDKDKDKDFDRSVRQPLRRMVRAIFKEAEAEIQRMYDTTPMAYRCEELKGMRQAKKRIEKLRKAVK